jgi:hypothetical protein
MSKAQLVITAVVPESAGIVWFSQWRPRRLAKLPRLNTLR